jgi:4-alpha-glucanotransferase
LRDRKDEALRQVEQEDRGALQREKFLQYLFYKQWGSLKLYCNQRNVELLGDLPIYVGFDSADVWVHPHLFKLDDEKNPLFVSGVPPDYFSESGQLWGNPVYAWDRLQEGGFDWWVKRMVHQSRLFDLIRIDHFRGLIAYWEIPANEKTALRGKWVKVPWQDFFDTIRKHVPELSIIAEDLGFITPDVKEARERLGFPGMKVLLFAFGEDHPLHPYLPHMFEPNCVAYTGTHDNNTIRGWFEKEARPEEKRRLFRYLGRTLETEELHWELIRLALMSVAKTVILPMQDILGLGEDARMNRPATVSGNWEWRLLPGQITAEVGSKLLEMTEVYGRG